MLPSMPGPWRILRQGRSSEVSLAYAFFRLNCVAVSRVAACAVSALLLFSSAHISGGSNGSLPGAPRAPDRFVDGVKQGLFLQWFPKAGN